MFYYHPVMQLLHGISFTTVLFCLEWYKSDFFPLCVIARKYFKMYGFLRTRFHFTIENDTSEKHLCQLLLLCNQRCTICQNKNILVTTAERAKISRAGQTVT
jgi:hypothetical protein